MNKAPSTVRLLLVTVLAVGGFALPLSADAHEWAQGQGSYLLGPEMPTLFTFDHGSMSCSVSWGTLAAPGPGPFSDPKMKLDRVNFGMVVYSLTVSSFQAVRNRVTMTGLARSITTVNERIVENAVYQFRVEAVDGGPPSEDTFSMTLEGKGLMFDGHTFAPSPGKGLVAGNVAILP